MAEPDEDTLNTRLEREFGGGSVAPSPEGAEHATVRRWHGFFSKGVLLTCLLALAARVIMGCTPAGEPGEKPKPTLEVEGEYNLPGGSKTEVCYQQGLDGSFQIKAVGAEPGSQLIIEDGKASNLDLGDSPIALLALGGSPLEKEVAKDGPYTVKLVNGGKTLNFWYLDLRTPLNSSSAEEYSLGTGTFGPGQGWIKLRDEEGNTKTYPLGQAFRAGAGKYDAEVWGDNTLIYKPKVEIVTRDANNLGKYSLIPDYYGLVTDKNKRSKHVSLLDLLAYYCRGNLKPITIGGGITNRKEFVCYIDPKENPEFVRALIEDNMPDGPRNAYFLTDNPDPYSVPLTQVFAHIYKGIGDQRLKIGDSYQKFDVELTYPPLAVHRELLAIVLDTNPDPNGLWKDYFEKYGLDKPILLGTAPILIYSPDGKRITGILPIEAVLFEVMCGANPDMKISDLSSPSLPDVLKGTVIPTEVKPGIYVGKGAASAKLNSDVFASAIDKYLAN